MRVAARGVSSASTPEREGRVGGHRRAPSVCPGAAGVEGDVDRDRHEHAADGGHGREHDPAALAQLPEVELALGLEPHHQEEERHQPLVDPVAQIQGHARAADPDRHHRRPGGLIGAGRDVRPQQRHDGGREHQRRAAGFGVEEVPHGRSQVPPPGRPLGERECAPVGVHGRASLARGCRAKTSCARSFSAPLPSAPPRRCRHASQRGDR